MTKSILVLLFLCLSSLHAQVTDALLGQPPGKDWLHYNGSYTSQRNSQLKQIDLSNVGSLVSKWPSMSLVEHLCRVCRSW